MTALPATVMPEGPLRHQDNRDPFQEEQTIDPIKRAALRCLGVAAVMAAIGIWMVPTLPGDAAMQLVKLTLSLGLLLGGAIMFTALRGVAGPEVHIDPRSRRLTIVERGLDGKVRMEVSHDIDTLSEIVLRDHLLTARDAQGHPLLALSVTDPQAEAAIRDLLAGARG